jgi:hypothetical protein
MHFCSSSVLLQQLNVFRFYIFSNAILSFIALTCTAELFADLSVTAQGEIVSLMEQSSLENMLVIDFTQKHSKSMHAHRLF